MQFQSFKKNVDYFKFKKGKWEGTQHLYNFW